MQATWDTIPIARTQLGYVPRRRSCSASDHYHGWKWVMARAGARVSEGKAYTPPSVGGSLRGSPSPFRGSTGGYWLVGSWLGSASSWLGATTFGLAGPKSGPLEKAPDCCGSGALTEALTSALPEASAGASFRPLLGASASALAVASACRSRELACLDFRALVNILRRGCQM